MGSPAAVRGGAAVSHEHFECDEHTPHKMLRTPSMHICFDGSFRGVCGGCGAVLWLDNVLLWEGARFLPRCPSSTAAEYEGLLLGLAAAAQHALEPSMPAALTVEGDCRVVLTQFEGRATPRKLSKLHARAHEHTRTHACTHMHMRAHTQTHTEART